MTFIQTVLTGTFAMAPAPGGGSGEQSPVFMFGWLGLMLVIFYFMLIRPQQRRDKERRGLLSQIKSGDRVIFGGGLIGVVANVKDKTFVIKVGEKMKLEVLRSAVTQVVNEGDLPAEAEADAPAAKA
jgi:preprotein translocase subunit YajC